MYAKTEPDKGSKGITTFMSVIGCTMIQHSDIADLDTLYQQYREGNEGILNSPEA